MHGTLANVVGERDGKVADEEQHRLRMLTEAPYQMPEIIVVPIAGGFSPYLNWIVQETKKDVNV